MQQKKAKQALATRYDYGYDAGEHPFELVELARQKKQTGNTGEGRDRPANNDNVPQLWPQLQRRDPRERFGRDDAWAPPRKSPPRGQALERAQPRSRRAYEEDEGDEEEERMPLNPPEWLKHRWTLKSKFPDGWAPSKRVSREAMSLMRTMYQADPVKYSTPVLAEAFKIGPEAVRRILRSKFVLSEEEARKRDERRGKTAREHRTQISQAEQEELEEIRSMFRTERRQARSSSPRPSQRSRTRRA